MLEGKKKQLSESAEKLNEGLASLGQNANAGLVALAAAIVILAGALVAVQVIKNHG
jgi:hypothetical protein